MVAEAELRSQTMQKVKNVIESHSLVNVCQIVYPFAFGCLNKCPMSKSLCHCETRIVGEPMGLELETH